MRKRIFLALVAGLLAFRDMRAQQDVGPAMSQADANKSSDREKAGLRGPVRSVIEEQTYPAWADSEGKAFPASENWNKTEYDRDGRLVARSFRAHSPEQRADSLVVTRYNYTPAGKILSRTVEADGKVGGETTYDYDDQGRLRSIRNSAAPDNPIAFHYDASGRKTKIAISKPVQLPGGVGAVSQSMEHIFDDQGGLMTWEGGMMSTLYDEKDRPTEVQLRNGAGALMNRAARVYDDRGRVLEEKMVVDDPLTMLPQQERKRLLEAGAADEQLRAKFAEFLGGSDMWTVKYIYDAQGRKSQTIRTTFNHIFEQTDTSYNEHGDVAKETTRSTMTGTPDGASDENGTAEKVFSYEYDSYGNWTSKKTSSRALPDGTLKETGPLERRTIEYY